MDCQPPLSYVDYSQCAGVLWERGIAAQRERCEEAGGGTIVVDEITVSGVTYSIQIKCDDLGSAELPVPDSDEGGEQ